MATIQLWYTEVLLLLKLSQVQPSPPPSPAFTQYPICPLPSFLAPKYWCLSPFPSPTPPPFPPFSGDILPAPVPSRPLRPSLSPSHQALTGVTENENPEISGASVTQVGSTTTLAFTRPLAPADATKTALSSEEGESLFMLWAYGEGNELTYHGSRGTASLSDLFCTAELSGEDAAEDLEATTEDCTSSDPDYDFEIAPTGDSDELLLFWSVVGTSVSVKV